MTEEELAGFKPNRYLARSWALLTRDRGWIKPVIVLTVALLVPIVGLLGLWGYAYEWARLTSWNVNAAPKQSGVAVGACIKSGARALVVYIVWALILIVLEAVRDAVFPRGLIVLLWPLVDLALDVVSMVPALRATIYERVSAGIDPNAFKALWTMVRHDWRGLVRIVGIEVAITAIAWVAIGLVGGATLASFLFRVVMFATGFYASEPGYALSMLFGAIEALSPALVVLVLLFLLSVVLKTLLCTTAVGLWMRQFDVASWKGPDAELTAPERRDAASPTGRPAPPSPGGIGTAGEPSGGASDECGDEGPISVG